MASLHSSSAEAEGAALWLQLELERLAGGEPGSEPTGPSGTFPTQRYYCTKRFQLIRKESLDPPRNSRESQ